LFIRRTGDLEGAVIHFLRLSEPSGVGQEVAEPPEGRWIAAAFTAPNSTTMSRIWRLCLLAPAPIRPG
jgi:hypothetical protein